MACVYDGGVVLGADTRVSTGIYVSNRASDKIAVLADSTVMCRSGSAADTEAVAGIVRYHVEQIGMERDDPPDVKTVAQIANQVPSALKGLALFLFCFVCPTPVCTTKTRHSCLCFCVFVESLAEMLLLHSCLLPLPFLARRSTTKTRGPTAVTAWVRT